MARQGKRWTIEAALGKLARHYGPAANPGPKDPWGQVLWENVAYMADDRRRAEAFRALRTTVGTAPKAIAKAPAAKLVAISSRGILAKQNAEKLRECAQIMVDDFGGDPKALAALPPDDLRKALRRFPRIGKPAADRILLFAGGAATPSLDSNGLRVLLRLGYGREEPSYAKSYASVLPALTRALTDAGALIEAQQLLRRHGKELCRRSKPKCGKCPLLAKCPTGATQES